MIHICLHMYIPWCLLSYLCLMLDYFLCMWDIVLPYYNMFFNVFFFWYHCIYPRCWFGFLFHFIRLLCIFLNLGLAFLVLSQNESWIFLHSFSLLVFEWVIDIFHTSYTFLFWIFRGYISYWLYLLPPPTHILCMYYCHMNYLILN